NRGVPSVASINLTSSDTPGRCPPNPAAHVTAGRESFHPRAAMTSSRSGVLPETLREQLFTDLGALAAVGLRLAEQFGDLVVSGPFGVVAVRLHPQRVAQTHLGERDEVEVLVLGAGDPTGLVILGHCSAPLDRFVVSPVAAPVQGLPGARRGKPLPGMA